MRSWKYRLEPKSLRQRLLFFLLLPVAAFLLSLGSVGLVFVREALLHEWRESAILKLERAAHFVDMDLHRVKDLIEMYHSAAHSEYSQEIREWIAEQLKQLEGVERVDLTMFDKSGESISRRGHDRGPPRHPFGAHRRHNRSSSPIELTPPRFDSIVDHQTVSLISELKTSDNQVVGELEVVVRFDRLIKNIVASSWWQGNKAFLVENSGKVLTCTVGNVHSLGCDSDPLELATLNELKEKPFGTIWGEGHPPKEISGFYKLKEAPWSIVVIAPGKEVLAPIIQFRNYYIAIGALSILLILILIRQVTASTVATIKDVSLAAHNVARGTCCNVLPVKSRDEVGQLVQSFNTMVLQLEERMRLKEAMDLAMEVQQSFLPRRAPEIPGVEIAGKSVYCDETGGDYYDFIQLPEMRPHQIGIVVGDMVGHGIAAALLMTTVRASLRGRLLGLSGISAAITDVNKLLCLDAGKTSSFATLFFMLLDSQTRQVQWVRAGHDPALVYDPTTDQFSELRGEGIALGIDEDFSFQEYVYSGLSDGWIALIGTDGIWEAENPEGERFGKSRLKEIVRQKQKASPQAIIHSVMEALDAFRQTAPLRDDITMVALKVNSRARPDIQDRAAPEAST